MTHPNNDLTGQDIYDEFTAGDPRLAQRRTYGFLDGVDALPAFRWYKRQLRTLMDLQPGEAMLDVGCGAGTEACRIAAEYPDVRVFGLDREATLAEATERAARAGVEVTWLPGEAEAIPLPDGSVDACMTERVLKYLPDPARGVAEMVRVPRPGGRIACFELDQQATVFGGDPEASRLVNDMLCDRLGEPRMGRRLPGLLQEHGLTDVTFEPVAWHMPHELNNAIVYEPVRIAIADGRLPGFITTWLDHHQTAARNGLFTIGWIGWIVGGTLNR